MIPSSHKFPLRTDFLAFRSRARQITTPHTRVLYLESSVSPRLAVIVPKKAAKLATTRNWLKRMTYETLWPQLKDKQVNVVVLYKPLPLQKSPTTKQQIFSELTSYFLKLKS